VPPPIKGALVLIELMVLSIFYLYAFGIVKIKPSSAPGYDASQVRLQLSCCCSVYWLSWVIGTVRLFFDRGRVCHVVAVLCLELGGSVVRERSFYVQVASTVL
jgi:hypothetical protein